MALITHYIGGHMVKAIERAYRATDRQHNRPIWIAPEYPSQTAQEGQGFIDRLASTLVADGQAKGKDEALKLIYTTWRR